MQPTTWTYTAHGSPRTKRGEAAAWASARVRWIWPSCWRPTPGSAAQHVRHRHGRGPLIFRADEDTISSKELGTAYKADVGGEGARGVGREGGYFNLERELAPANAGKGMATHHGQILHQQPCVDSQHSHHCVLHGGIN